MPKATETDVRWTASKCMRLLRPITSRIGPLEKLAPGAKNVDGEGKNPALPAGTEGENDECRTTTSLDHDEDADDDDDDKGEPDWLTAGARKGRMMMTATTARKTYARRRPRFRRRATTPVKTAVDAGRGEAVPVLPTPYRTGTGSRPDAMTGPTAPSPPAARPGPMRKPPSRREVRPRANIRIARAGKVQRREDLEEGLLSGLSSLLHATQVRDASSDLSLKYAPSPVPTVDEDSFPTTSHARVWTGRRFELPGSEVKGNAGVKVRVHPPQRGAASLFVMCLRALPAVIEEEKALRSGPSCGLDDEAADAVGDMYGELEELGTERGCYTPLREIVRAHGLGLVLQCVRRGLVKEGKERQIYAEVWEKGTREEVLRVVEVMMHRHALVRPPCLYDCWYRGGRSSTEPDFDVVFVADKMPKPVRGVPVRMVAEGFATGKLTFDLLREDEWRVWMMDSCSSLAREEAGESLQGLHVLLWAACGVPVMLGKKKTAWDLTGSPRGPVQSLGHTSSLDQLQTLLAAMAVIGFGREIGDGKLLMAQSITSVLRTIAGDIMANTAVLGTKGAGTTDYPRIWGPLAIKMLTLVLVLQELDGGTGSCASSIKAADALGAMHSLEKVLADRSWLQHAVTALHSVALCVGVEDRDRSVEVLGICVRPLVELAREEAASESLQELCCETTRRFAKSYPLPSTRKLVHDIDVACQGIGGGCGLDDLLDVESGDAMVLRESIQFDQGLREWMVSPIKARNVIDLKRPSPEPERGGRHKRVRGGLHDSGHASVVRIPETPSKPRTKVWVASPDELGAPVTPRENLGILARSDSDQGNGAAPPRDVSSQALALCSSPLKSAHVDTSSGDQDELDELALSGKKRPRSRVTIYGRNSTGSTMIVEEDPDMDELG